LRAPAAAGRAPEVWTVDAVEAPEILAQVIAARWRAAQAETAPPPPPRAPRGAPA
jgi:hypothetical protein